jgi:putative hydrolase of the HAD superfamily
VQIITFDFHNTVAHCDPWFELEIRTLPAAVLGRLADANAETLTLGTFDRATELYRALRRDVITTGVEQDAVRGVAQVFTELGIDHDEAALSDIIDLLMRDCLSALSPVPDSVELISTLIDAGIPVGIISSAVHHQFLEWTLNRFGILDRLAFVATSASIGHYKSVTTIYEAAYALVDADRSLGVHIGDSPRWDIDTAQRAGLAAVLYEPGRQSAPVEDGFSPDMVLETFENACQPLLDLLERRKAGAVA